MQQWLDRGQWHSRGTCHRVGGEFGRGDLQGPGRVVDFATKDFPTSIQGVQAISLGQEMLQRAGRCLEDRISWAISDPQRCSRCAAIRSFALIVNRSVRVFTLHACTEIRKVKPGTGDFHGQGIRRIKAEKPDAWLSACFHVSTHIQFGKSRQAGHVRCQADPHAGHPEGNNRDPSTAVEGVDLECSRNFSSKQRRVDRPVREQQIMPGLRHDPRTGRHRPRSVICPMQYFQHPSERALGLTRVVGGVILNIPSECARESKSAYSNRLKRTKGAKFDATQS
jgi:hypothetical protein